MSIVFKDNKLKVEDQEPVELNGVYQGIIAASSQISENEFWCYVYIPDIYGKHDYVYSSVTSYPKISVPKRIDNDDPGYTPQVGDLVKVSFDDGNTNSCRLIHIYQINDLIKQANRLYLEQGIISADPLSFESVTNDMITKLKPIVDIMYFVTLGRNYIQKTDYSIKILEDSFNNYGNQLVKIFYMSPLMMPLTMVSHDNNEPAANFIVSKKVLDIGAICKEYLNWYNYSINNIKTLSNLFNAVVMGSNIEYTYLKRYNSASNSVKAIFMLQLISGNSTHFDYDRNELIDFPSDDNTLNFDLSRLKPYYYKYYEDNSVNSNIYDFMYENKYIYEITWLTNIASWLPAINSIVLNTTSNSPRGLEIIVAMCLSICPWVTPAFLNLGEDLFCYWGSDTEVTEDIRVGLRKPSAFTSINLFIDNFQSVTKECFLLSSWILNDMDSKFQRLKAKANDIINIYSPISNSAQASVNTTSSQSTIVSNEIPLSDDVQKYAQQVCKDYNISYALLLGLISVESRFIPTAISEGGDYGLCQINITNHDFLRTMFGITNFLDPKQNILCGAYLLRANIDFAGGGIEKGLMAYNMGGGNAQDFWAKGIYSNNYSQEVIKEYQRFSAILSS